MITVAPTGMLGDSDGLCIVSSGIERQNLPSLTSKNVVILSTFPIVSLLFNIRKEIASPPRKVWDLGTSFFCTRDDSGDDTPYRR